MFTCSLKISANVAVRLPRPHSKNERTVSCSYSSMVYTLAGVRGRIDCFLLLWVKLPTTARLDERLPLKMNIHENRDLLEKLPVPRTYGQNKHTISCQSIGLGTKSCENLRDIDTMQMGSKVVVPETPGLNIKVSRELFSLWKRG